MLLNRLISSTLKESTTIDFHIYVESVGDGKVLFFKGHHQIFVFRLVISCSIPYIISLLIVTSTPKLPSGSLTSLPTRPL